MYSLQTAILSLTFVLAIAVTSKIHVSFPCLSTFEFLQSGLYICHSAIIKKKYILHNPGQSM